MIKSYIGIQSNYNMFVLFLLIKKLFLIKRDILSFTNLTLVKFKNNT